MTMAVVSNDVLQPDTPNTAKKNASTSLLEMKRLQPCSIARHDMASTLVTQDGDKDPTSAKPIGILLVGGRSEEQDANELSVAELFEWSSKRWWTLPTLQQARCGCAVASIGRTFYVFGGVGGDHTPDNEGNNSESNSMVECLTMGDKAWKSLSSMTQDRWYASAVSFPQRETIILLGGRDPSQWQELDTVEAFDTERHEWISCARMSQARFGFGSTRINNSTLLVVGGYNGKEWSKSCEIYNFDENEWSHIADIPLEDLQFITATKLTDDFILISGQIAGDSGENSAAFILYQISKDEWIPLPISMGEELVGCTTVAIGGKHVVSVGGTDQDGLATKDTRISTNLLHVLTAILHAPLAIDDVTITTYRSSSSNSKTQETVPLSGLSDDDGVSPWWFSPANSTRQLAPGSESSLISPETSHGPVSHISLIRQAESVISGQTDEYSACHSFDDYSDHGSFGTLDISGMSPGSGRHRKRGKREKVSNFKTFDANGVPVVYSGGTLQGQLAGKGRMMYENGDVYNGCFKRGKRQGKGCQSYADGRQYEGRFENDLPHDENGQMSWKDGTIYIGGFIAGKRTGSGIQRFPSSVRYEGEFVNGKYHGTGCCVFADGSVYEGEWIHGKAHGKGTLTDRTGAVIHNGLWQNDSPTL